jgi:hypothetical protein
MGKGTIRNRPTRRTVTTGLLRGAATGKGCLGPLTEAAASARRRGFTAPKAESRPGRHGPTRSLSVPGVGGRGGGGGGGNADEWGRWAGTTGPQN